VGDEPYRAEKAMHTVAVTNSYEAEQLTIAEKIVAHLNELTINEMHQLCT